MEVIGIGLQAIGKAIGSIAFWWAMIYIVGIISKTILIYEEKMTVEESKDWFLFFFSKREKERRGKGNRL